MGHVLTDIIQIPTTSGRQIAEWVMNNRGTLGLKYVIWGQKIWNPSVDGVKAWTSWRNMEDRGDITANHWYVLTSNFRFGCEKLL